MRKFHAVALAMTTILSAPSHAAVLGSIQYNGIFEGSTPLSGIVSGEVDNSYNNMTIFTKPFGYGLDFHSLVTIVNFNPIAQTLYIGGGTGSSAGSGYFTLTASGITAAGADLTMSDLLGKTANISYQNFQYSTTVTGTATFGPRLIKPVGPLPEPASWALMIGGIAVAGGAMRRRRTVGA